MRKPVRPMYIVASLLVSCAPAARSVAAPEAPLRLPATARFCKPDADACGQRGRSLMRAHDYRGALEQWEHACEEGAPWCSAAAELLEDGKLVPRDEARARALDRRGCELGDGGACDAEGIDSYFAEGPRRDRVHAVHVWERGCVDIHNVECCIKLAAASFEGQGKPRDEAYAEDLLANACASGHRVACVDLARVYASATTDIPGRGVRVLGSQCNDMNGSACYGLAQLYARGAHVTLDAARAAALAERACMLGEPLGCKD